MATTERMIELQSICVKNKNNWLSFYDVYPTKIFDEAKQRLTILINSDGNGKIFTTKYNRWLIDERDNLIDNLGYSNSSYIKELAVIPKLNSGLSADIYKKINMMQPEEYIKNDLQANFYVHRIPYNFIKALDFTPYFFNEKDGEKKSEDYKEYALSNKKNKMLVIGALNSNLFFYYWYLLFEGYHCGKHEIYSFPLSSNKIKKVKELEKLAIELMDDINKNKFKKECIYKTTGKVIYEELYPKLSKRKIDSIDKILAEHYGFTQEELDFIINYDIKYRMGSELEEEGEE